MGTSVARRTEAVRIQGVVKKGKLTVAQKVDLPDGKVEVTLLPEAAPKKKEEYEDLSKHPAFGICKDNKEMQDTVAYARKIRDSFNREFAGGRNARRQHRVD